MNRLSRSIALGPPGLGPPGLGERVSGSGSRGVGLGAMVSKQSPLGTGSPRVALGEPPPCESTPGTHSRNRPPASWPACATGSSTVPSWRWELRSREQSPRLT
jgi:hypothetical protein